MTTHVVPPPQACALVVVDVQVKLARAMGDLELRRTRMAQAVLTADLLGCETVVTEQVPQALGSTIPELASLIPESASVVSKTAFSCWGAPEFAARIDSSRPEALILIGMEAHVCVMQTALDSLARNYKVAVLADAVCSRTDLDRTAALALMQSRGVTVTTYEAVAFDWLRDSTHPRFRDVSRIVKGVDSRLTDAPPPA